MTAYRSKPTYRVITLTHLGAKACLSLATRVSATYSDSALVGLLYLVEDLLGFRPEVLPGVLLLSRRR